MSPAAARMAIDPVCGMTVNVEESRAEGLALEHNGTTYVFCSAGCLAEFVASPQTYEGQAEPGPGDST